MKHADTTIQIRVDTKTKEDARKVLDEIGLDFSSAMKLFLKKVVQTESIPFELRTENGFTLAQEKKILEETEWALKHGKRYDSIEELHKDLVT